MDKETMAGGDRLKTVRGVGVLGRVLSIASLIFASVTVLMVVYLALTPVGEVTMSPDGSSGLAYSYSAGLGPEAAVEIPAAAPAPEQVTLMRDLTLVERAAMIISIAIPSGFIVWGLWGAHRCFSGLARGRYFDPSTIRGLRNLALGVVLSMISEPIVDTLAQPFMPRASDTISVSLSISGDGALLFIVAGAVALISTVLTRAAEIAAENEQFV